MHFTAFVSSVDIFIMKSYVMHSTVDLGKCVKNLTIRINVSIKTQSKMYFTILKQSHSPVQFIEIYFNEHFSLTMIVHMLAMS